MSKHYEQLHLFNRVLEEEVRCKTLWWVSGCIDGQGHWMPVILFIYFFFFELLHRFWLA